MISSIRRQKAPRQEAGGSPDEKNFTTMHENSFLHVRCVTASGASPHLY
ncbi:MAG: hypothetical protein F6K47_14455 [Symploca sp. SIO2E6]|nr:hypothetical protein [Symploca sp. SIO2E6]